MAKIGIFYASGKGDTKKACEYLAGKIGGELIAVKEANGEDFEKYDVLILASPSYDFAELHGDWKAKLGALKSANLSGKLVALVGVGNQERHPDSFVGGIVDFLPCVKDARLVGQSEKDGYDFKYSQAFIGGKFIGLALDTKGDANYEARIGKWVSLLNPEIHIFR